MSKQTCNFDSTARVPLFLFLMGTLAFSLSTLPSPQRSVQVKSLSSEFASDCIRMVDRIDAGANADSCKIDDNSSSGELANVTGHVEVKLDTKPSRDPHDVDKIVSSQKWKYTLTIYGTGDPIEKSDFINKEDYKSITEKVKSTYKLLAAEMAARIKQAKIDEAKKREKLVKIERCEINEDGKTLEGKARLNCRMGKLAGMDDEKAADYYEQYILPEIEKLLSSSNVREQRQGMAFLKQLNAANVGGDFVKESIADLAKFGQLKYASDQQKLQIMAMAPNDPRRAAAIQQMRMSQFQADSYFQSRGLKIQSEDWPLGTSTGFDFASTLTDNLASFQTKLDQNYAALLQQHQYLLQNPSSLPPTPQQQQQTQTPVTPTANNTPTQPFPSGTQFTAPQTPVTPTNQAQVSKATIPRTLSKR